MDDKPELPSPERVEQLRRSVVMLQPGAPALNREQAEWLYATLVEALLEVRRLRSPPPPTGPRPLST